MAATVAETATPVSTLGSQIGWLLRRAKLAAIALVALFFLVLALEAARLLQAAAGIHPALGALVGIALAAGACWLGVPLWRALRVPRAVTPPAVPADDAYSPRHLAEQARYLDQYLRGCRRNPELREQAAAVDDAARELAVLRPRWEASDRASLPAARDEMRQWVERRLEPLLAPLDEKAERLIHQEALGVGLGTAISPNGTLDAFVVCWRSIQMSSRLAVLYYGRPGPRGTLRILIDVAVASAAASYLQHVGHSLGGLVARSIGGIAGVVAGPATQGITNALVMARLGYLVQRRCRSFQRWDPGTQRSALADAAAATQRVALGLVTEILRQAGSGLGVVAGAVVKGASSAVEGIASAAGSLVDFTRDLGQKISNGLRPKE